MYLKSIKLVGFKSFADRTRLELRPGVTVVVGPNGSGKSNVVDAISWVMGSQSPKALRTGKMEDVVFAGTATRPALNRAEATVVIDNEDRELDLDLDEVSITRRLYRDGSSDYELNGVSCRLLDIEELLSDSGVGRHQHVIIGQGQVDRVLNASPEDHRAVIEEAAGILKHRKRKEKAERRLDRTGEDLVRLQDLLGEITRQMRPLKRQARAAEKYNGLKGEVTALTLYLSGQELRAIESGLLSGEAERAELRSGLDERSIRIDTLRSQVEKLSTEAATVGSTLERDSSAAARLETTTERLRRLGSVAHERRRAVTGRRQAAVERRADLASEEADLTEELRDILSTETAASKAAAASEERFRRLEAEQDAIATQNALSPEGALAAVRGELSVLESAAVRDSREVEAIEQRLSVLAAQRADESAEIDRINTEIREIDTEIADLQRRYELSMKQRLSDQEAWTSAEERFNEAKLESAAANARVEAVRSALDGQFDMEARSQLEGSPGALGSLASQLDVPAGLERAVDAALGVWSDSVAFEEVDSLATAVERIKSGGLGGVPVVAALSEGATPAVELASDIGLDALVDRLGPGTNRNLASRLLGDVVLVEGWASAWKLVSKHPALRAVTPEGDLISVSGIRISNPDGAGVVMLEAAEVAQEKAATELARAESHHGSARRDFERSRETERGHLEELESAEAKLSGRTEAMARLQKSVDGLAAESDRLEPRLESLKQGESDRSRQRTELKARLASLEGEEAERMQAWEELESKRIRVAADREIARAEWQEASERLRAIRERRDLHEDRLNRIENELKRLDEGGSQPAESAEALDLVESTARQAVTDLEAQLARLRTRQAGLREQNTELLSNLESARSEFETSRSESEEMRERLSVLEVKLTEFRMSKESVAERLRRDADATVEMALSAPEPDIETTEGYAPLLESRLAELRRLGPVNPLAAAEYAELEERHDFLAEQMADVESSRSELRKVIVALEEEIENRFQAAYIEVAGAYQKYFGILFPGGKGRIKLIDADDQASGLEIQAQPLGKKVSQLTLLSGGERSLAALAFLFAVFEARPSPFYVLDEVEAALDDANLRRFLKIVDEFRQQAQLVIITHQQQTMEAADVLYGVTMEPGGSSKVVRKVLSQIGASQTV